MDKDRKLQKQTYYLKNKERIKAYYLENRENIIRKVKSYYQINKTKKLEYESKKVYDENAKLKKKLYYQKNRDKLIEYQKLRLSYSTYSSRQNELQKAKSKINVIQLSDKYVKSLIYGKGKRNKIEFNSEIIEVKRAIILLQREIKSYDKRTSY